MNPGWDVSQRGSHEILVQVWEKGQIFFFFNVIGRLLFLLLCVAVICWIHYGHDPPPTECLIFIKFLFCRIPKPKKKREKATVLGMEGGVSIRAHTCVFNFNLNAYTSAKFIPLEDLGFFHSGQ